jgi:uncharacterized repeat protein (TIGR01451 family)
MLNLMHSRQRKSGRRLYRSATPCHCSAMRYITPTYKSPARNRCDLCWIEKAAKVLRCGISLFITSLLFTTVALADEPSPVQTTLVAEVRQTTDTSDGRRIQHFVPAAVVNQGEVVFYTLQIRNPTSVPIRDAVVIQRVPSNTTYVVDSASGPSADIMFSVDGGQSFWPEKELVVAKAATEARKAMPQDYTHIRWQLRNALAPGAVALARFQAVFR